MRFLFALGLAIGWMDIVGSLLFQLVVIFLLRRKWRENSDAEANAQPAEPTAELQRLNTLQGFNDPQLARRGIRTWQLWAYLVMLNCWILVSILMIAGIFMRNPNLMIYWMFWSLAGVFLDLLFLFLWLFELFLGDLLNALANVFVSVITMAIEIGFIYVVYCIYWSLQHEHQQLGVIFRFLHWLNPVYFNL